MVVRASVALCKGLLTMVLSLPCYILCISLCLLLYPFKLLTAILCALTEDPCLFCRCCHCCTRQNNKAVPESDDVMKLEELAAVRVGLLEETGEEKDESLACVNTSAAESSSVAAQPLLMEAENESTRPLLSVKQGDSTIPVA